MTDDFLDWLKELITNNQLEKFYHCKEWLEAAEQVKKIDHYECQECKRKGKLTTESTLNKKGNPIQMSVHHHKELKQFPELALSIYYTDTDGSERRNLEYVCESCHNKIHGKYKGRWKPKQPQQKKQQRMRFVNEEWW